MKLQSSKAVCDLIRSTVAEAPIFDLHTHLYAPCFGNLLRSDLDSTITYHYLIEETVLETRMNPADFWALPLNSQADLVWDTLFVKNPPVSESCKVILNMFKRDGADVNHKDLDYYRDFYSSFTREEYIDNTFKKQHVSGVVMTNDPFDKRESKIWLNGEYVKDERFLTALRVDDLVFYKPEAVRQMQEWGYNVEADNDGMPTENSLPEIRRFLVDWIDRMDALYCSASYPVSFSLEDGSAIAKVLTECILPVCKEKDIPVSMMLGVTRRVNPKMGEAGDSLGKIDITQLHKLFREYPDNRFLVTTLSMENQQELTATARIFNNVIIFGCWWFLNNPIFERQMIEMRYQLLGPKFVAQHSDANMIGHMTGKWERFKPIFADVLCRNYEDLMSLGYHPEEEQILKEIKDLFGEYSKRFFKS